MPSKTQPFVQWGLPRAHGVVAHLVRTGTSMPLCGEISVPYDVDAKAVRKRCRLCLKIYLKAMSATDELVGAFGEDGRMRR